MTVAGEDSIPNEEDDEAAPAEEALAEDEVCGELSAVTAESEGTMADAVGEADATDDVETVTGAVERTDRKVDDDGALEVSWDVALLLLPVKEDE